MGQPFSGNGPKTTGKPLTSIFNSLEMCSVQITPDCLRALYKIDYTPRSTDKNTFGIGSLCCLELIFQIFSMSLYSWIYASSTSRSRSWYVLRVYVVSACPPVCIKLFFSLSGTFHPVRSAWGLNLSQSMEVRDLIISSTNIAVTNFSLGVVQEKNKSFDFNGESALDFQYGMALTNPQPVKLLQVGDLIEG